ncbi:MAG: VWA domain-containing protein [Rhodobacteraceae bacterium]|nr:VWA domain-containing protein [Paracoccaceae bacterium]
MKTTKLKLSADFDRELFWHKGDSVRYLVARLTAENSGKKSQSKRPPVNIALVIDVSGSMTGEPLAAAKAAVLGLAGRLNKDDRLSVVSFASDVQVHFDGVAVTPTTLKKVEREVAKLHTRGSTFLSGGWFEGAALAAKAARGDSRLTPRVIVLSDGHANEGIIDPVGLSREAEELLQDGVTTSTLGIGDGYDEAVMRGIAENGGGRLHDAELTAEISSVLLGELDDIFNTVVEQATFELHSPADVRVEGVGLRTEQSAERLTTVMLGPLQGGISRNVVFKVVCPKADPDTVLRFELSASGKLSSDGSKIESNRVDAQLTSAKGKVLQKQLRKGDLAELVAQTWSSHVIATAAALNRDGAPRQAARFVRDELRFFKKYVVGLSNGISLVRQLETLANHAAKRLSSRMTKELVLASSIQLEERRDHRGFEKAHWSVRMARGD